LPCKKSTRQIIERETRETKGTLDLPKVIFCVGKSTAGPLGEAIEHIGFCEQIQCTVPSDILYGINKRFDCVKSNSVRQDDIESGFESRNVGVKPRQ
jgi:hypothetical protein